MIKMKKTKTQPDLLDPMKNEPITPDEVYTKACQEYIIKNANQFKKDYEKMKDHIKAITYKAIEDEITHISTLLDNQIYDDCLGDIEIELYKIRVSETQTPSTKNKNNIK